MNTHPLMGAICGDIIGNPYERYLNRTKDYNFELFPKGYHFTDDTFLTIAVAAWLMGERTDRRLIDLMRLYGRKYWRKGFSRTTLKWLFQNFIKNDKKFVDIKIFSNFASQILKA